MAGSKVKVKVTSPSKFENLPFSTSISSALLYHKFPAELFYKSSGNFPRNYSGKVPLFFGKISE